MKKDSDKKNLVLLDDGAAHGFTRWLPTIIVFCVVGGFFTLSWYAYHAGIESVKDEDLLVVEADKTPMKEKPADPGGMQFPNQDKTIFDTFSGNKAAPQNVERILPSPEEPMSKDLDTSETSTWINNKLTEAKPDANAKEQVLGKKKTEDKADKNDHQVIPVSSPDEDDSESYIAPKTKPTQALDNAVKADDQTKADTDKATKVAKDAAEKDAAVKAKADKEQADKDAAAKVKSDKDAAAKAKADKEQADKDAAAKVKSDKETAAKAKADKEQADKDTAAKAKADKEQAAKDAKAEKDAKLKADQEKAALQKAAAQAEKAQKADAKPVTKKSNGGGSASVQLGAYRSEEEAQDAWNKMHLKHKELSDKSPTIVRADLGSKGIYFRLRINGLDDASDAKSLCSALSSKGQPCILPTGN